MLYLAGAGSYTGDTFINAGQLALLTNGTVSGSANLVIASGATLSASGRTDGTLTLGVGQTLTGSGSVLGNVAGGANSAISPATNNAAGTLTISGTLALNGSTTLRLDLAGTTNWAANDQIIAGGLSLSGTTLVRCNFLGGMPVLNQPYTLIRYSGALGGAGGFTIPSTRYGYSFDTSTPGEIRVTFTAATSASLVWLGDGTTNTWDFGLTTNWLNGAALDFFSAGDNVVFNDSGSDTPAVNVVGSLGPTSLLVSNAAKSYTFGGSGRISGATGLTKQGSGLLALVTTNNNYTGITLVSGSTLAVAGLANAGAPSSIGAADTNPANLVLDAATLRYLGGTASANRGLTLSTASTLDLTNAAATLTISGSIIGAGSLTKNGNGTLYLSPPTTNDNSYAGGTIVNAGNISLYGQNRGLSVLGKGLVQINSGASVTAFGPNTLGQHWATTAPLFINGGAFYADQYNHINRITMNGGLLGIRSGVTQVDGMDFNTEGASTPLVTIQNNSATAVIASKFTLNGPMVIDVADGASPVDALLTGLIVGGSSLTKTGAGTLQLSNQLHTYTGGTFVNAGTLQLNMAGGAAGAIRGNVTVSPGATLQSLAWDSFGYTGGLTNLTVLGGTVTHTSTNNLTLGQIVINLSNAVFQTTDPLSRFDFLNSSLVLNTLPSAGSSFINGNILIRDSLATAAFNVADGTAADDLVVNAPIAEQVTGRAVAKNGAGRMVFNGVNTYSGGTLINAGTLALGAVASVSNSTLLTVAANAYFDVSAVNGGFNLNTSQTLAGSGAVLGRVTANANAVLSPGGDLVIGTLTLNSNVTLNTGSKLTFDLGSVTTPGGSANDLINVGGDLVVSSPVTVTISSVSVLATGTYRLVNYNGTPLPPGITNNFVIVNNTVNARPRPLSLDASVPGQINLIVGGGLPGSLVWRGLPTTDWNLIGIYSNWFNGTGPDVFFNTDPVRFDDTRLSTAAVNLTTTLQPGAVVVDTANSYTLSGLGKITGAAGLTKRGAGTLTLGATNDFTGSIVVEAGLLRHTVLGGFGNATGITVNNGAQMDITMYDASHIYSVSLAGSGPGGDGALKSSGGDVVWVGLRNLSLDADATINLNGRIDIGRAANVAGGSLNGNGHRLTKNGAGNMPIHTTTYNLAELIVNNGLVYGESTDYSLGTNVTVNPPGRLGAYAGRINNCAITLNGASLENAGGAPITWLGPLTLNGACSVNTLGQYSGGVSQNVIYNGPIGGTGSLTKINGASLILGGVNTYTGDTIISAGTVALSASGAIANSANINVGSGAIFDVSAQNGAFSVAPGQALIGVGTVAGVVAHTNSGAFILPGGTNVIGTITFSTNLILGGGTVGFDLTTVTNEGGASNDLLVVGGNLVLTNSSVLKLNFTQLAMDTAHPYTLINYAGAIVGDTANLSVVSDTHYVFTLDFGVTNKVRVAVSGGGPTALLWFGADGFYAADWDLMNTPSWDGNATFGQGDSVLFDAGAGSYIVNLVGALAPSAVSINSVNDYLFDGAGRLIGGGSFSKHSTASLTLANSGWNDYSGPTFIYGGTLQIGDGNLTGNLSPNTAVAVTNELGDDGATIYGTLAFNRSDTVTVSNSLSGSGSVVQQGSGRLVLAGPANFLGTVFVSAGTLECIGTLANGAAGVMVAGGTLADGVIPAPVVIQDGGTVAPGDSAIATLTISNTLTLRGNAAMSINKSGSTLTCDLIRVTSTLNYGGMLTVQASGNALAAGDTFKLFDATAYAGTITGFSLPTLDAGLVWVTTSLPVDGSIRVAQTYPVTGQVQLEGYMGLAHDGVGIRAVTFTATDSSGQVLDTWSLSLNFTNGAAGYTLPAVLANTARLSAKTAWNLRQRLDFFFSGGAATVNFTSAAKLPVGDLDGSNRVSLADYYRLAAAWYQADPAADLDGNGVVDLDDYFLLASHWNDTGAPE